MKFAAITFLVLALNSVSQGRPQAGPSTPVSVVSLIQNVDEKGFNYAFELSNGIKEEATGTAKAVKIPKIDPKTNLSTGDEDGQGGYNLTILININ